MEGGGGGARTAADRDFFFPGSLRLLVSRHDQFVGL